MKSIKPRFNLRLYPDVTFYKTPQKIFYKIPKETIIAEYAPRGTKVFFTYKDICFEADREDFEYLDGTRVLNLDQLYARHMK